MDATNNITRTFITLSLFGEFCKIDRIFARFRHLTVKKKVRHRRYVAIRVYLTLKMDIGIRLDVTRLQNIERTASWWTGLTEGERGAKLMCEVNKG